MKARQGLHRLARAGALAAAALLLGGCGALQSGISRVTLGAVENRVVPTNLLSSDLDAGCTYVGAMGPLLGAARGFDGDPRLLEAIVLHVSGTCAANHAAEQEFRYLRASRDKRVDEAQDARILQKRLQAVAARRQLESFTAMRSRLEQQYGFRYGQTCPRFSRDVDELAFLLGSISGVQAVQSRAVAQSGVTVPLDIPPDVAAAMTCLDNAKWWGAPQALQGVIWTIIPGAAQGRNLPAVFDRSMTLGERAGVRVAHVMAALAAQSNDDTPELRKIIKRFATATGFAPDARYRLIDTVTESLFDVYSDRLWTQGTGARTPVGRLGTFWDDSALRLDTDSFLK